MIKATASFETSPANYSETQLFIFDYTAVKTIFFFNVFTTFNSVAKITLKLKDEGVVRYRNTWHNGVRQHSNLERCLVNRHEQSDVVAGAENTF